MHGLDISVSYVVCQSSLLRNPDHPDAMEDDVMEHDPHLWLGRLTAAMIRGQTELHVRVDEEMSCVLVEMDGTPYQVLLGVTMTGAENLHTAITTGLNDLAVRQQKTTGDQTLSGADGQQRS
jgi:hypothetical protein